jgi:tRNA-Thr(GGU) m(6)t(6)A37 methyltransferase TsaA
MRWYIQKKSESFSPGAAVGADRFVRITGDALSGLTIGGFGSDLKRAQGGFLAGIKLEPIGIVHNGIRKKKREGWEAVVSEITLSPKYEEGLEGIEEYSHVLVLFWLSRVPPNARGRRLKIHPRSRMDLPRVGIFATRTQYRPNPIGLTQVRLLKRDKNTLRVKGLDALNGTPVLDIKPISPRTEIPAKIRVPDWVRRLWGKRPPGRRARGRGGK